MQTDMNPISKKIDIHKRNVAKDEQDKFIDAFSDVLSKGDSSAYEDYLDPLASVITQVWSLRNEDDSIYTLDTLENNCGKLLVACADSDDSGSKVLCLKLLAFIYETVYEQILEEGIKPRGINKIRHFEVINYFNLFKFFNNIFMKVPTPAIVGQFDLSKLLYHMMITDLCLTIDHESTETDENIVKESFVWIPHSTILDMLRFVGRYVSEQEKNGSVDGMTLSYWSKQIHFWLAHSIDEDTSNEFNYIDREYRKYMIPALTNASTMLVCGLMNYGQFDIVHEGLYSKIVHIEDLPDSVEIKRRVITISRAFLYYMAYRESENFVDKALRKSARGFIADTRGEYLDFIDHHDVSDILIDELSTDFALDEDGNRIPVYREYHIKELLKAFDYRMRNNGFGVLILESVVRDFCLFSILYNNNKCIGKVGFPLNSYGVDGLDWMIDKRHRIEDFISYVQESSSNFVYSSNYTNLETLLKGIKQYIDFIDPYQRESENTSTAMYETLVNGIKSRYKSTIVQEAFNSDLEYRQSQANNIKIQYPKIPEWEEKLRQGIAEKFKKDGSNNSFIETIQYNNSTSHSTDRRIYKGICYLKDTVLYSLCNYTKLIDSSVDTTAVDRVCGELMDRYISMMISAGMLEKISKTTDLYDDHEYIKIISERKYDMMLGSEYLVRNKDYALSENFNEVTKGFAKITGHSTLYGAVLNSCGVVFYLSKLHVRVRDADIGDLYSVTELNDGTYEYEQIGGVKLQFTEDELRTYLNRERKVIEVMADVGIKKVGDEDIIGIYIENERIYSVGNSDKEINHNID